MFAYLDIIHRLRHKIQLLGSQKFCVHASTAHGCFGSENKTVTTTELHYDLTHLMRASSFSNRYAVEVRAVEGAETSQHVSSPIITFNILKMADVKCEFAFLKHLANDSGPSMCKIVTFLGGFLLHRCPGFPSC